MTTSERDDIYRTKYWTGARCDDLPSGVDYCVFDGAVNSGVAQSVKWLQRAIGGVVVDGHAGDVTVTSAGDLNPADLVQNVCNQRMTFLQSLRTFKTFGKGWSRRVNGVRATALAMTDHVEPDGATERYAPSAKAKIVDQAEPMVSANTATAATAGTASASAIVQQVQEQLAPFSDALTMVKYALIACAVLGLGFTIYAMVRANRVRAVS